MSEVNLLVFGCLVSFIAAAGAYVYVRECFTAQDQPSEAERSRDIVKAKLQDVA